MLKRREDRLVMHADAFRLAIDLNILPFLSDAFPPDNAPNGKAPVGVNPFNCNTDSDSSLWGIRRRKESAGKLV